MALEEEKCEICGSYAVLKESIVDGSHEKICSTCVHTHQAIVLEKPTGEQIANIHRPVLRKEFEKSREEARKRERLWNFGRIVKEAREKADMTQKEISEAIAEPENIVSDLENGKGAEEKVVVKLKQFLRTRLRKPTEVPKKQEEKEEINFNSDMKISDLKSIEEEQEKE